MPKIPAWGWIALAIGAILLLKPRLAVGAGQVRPAGSLSQVAMGAAITKLRTQPVTVNFNFIAATKNAAGALIPWSYKYQIDLVGVVDNVPIDFTITPFFTSAPGTFPVAHPMTLANAVDFRLYQAVVTLSAAASNPDGTPNLAQLIDLDTKISTDTVSVQPPPSTVAVPAGSIVAPITLTQRLAQEFFG